MGRHLIARSKLQCCFVLPPTSFLTFRSTSPPTKNDHSHYSLSFKFGGPKKKVRKKLSLDGCSVFLLAFIKTRQHDLDHIWSYLYTLSGRRAWVGREKTHLYGGTRVEVGAHSVAYFQFLNAKMDRDNAPNRVVTSYHLEIIPCVKLEPGFLPISKSKRQQIFSPLQTFKAPFSTF